jgi:hypothetical protein
VGQFGFPQTRFSIPKVVQLEPYRGIRLYVLKNRERWIEICALAAEELDPVKLLTLTQEINRLLEEKQQRLKGTAPKESMTVGKGKANTA